MKKTLLIDIIFSIFIVSIVFLAVRYSLSAKSTTQYQERPDYAEYMNQAREMCRGEVKSFKLNRESGGIIDPVVECK